MHELRLTGGAYRPVPPGFVAMWMAPGCVFYAARSTVKQGIEMIERDVQAGRVTVPEGMTAAQMTVNSQAWALARTNVAGSA